MQVPDGKVPHPDGEQTVSEEEPDAEVSASCVTSTMGGRQYLMLKEQAWKRLQAYYEALAK